MNVKLEKSLSMQEKSICNVIWVDDEIENICPEFGLGGLKRDLKKYNIEVIGKAHSFLEFKELMAICKDRVDAVITDANFNDVSRAVAKDDDFKGLIKMIRIIESYNERRDIPFYLYSGKGAYFSFQNGELDYFDDNGRRFNKGDYEKMFKRIREDVEHINSSSFRIRKKYTKELKAASLIEGNEECLMDALLYDYSDEWEKTEDYFNPIRKVGESIFDECKRLKIIPPIYELNAISRFLNYGCNENFSVISGEEIMPKPLARSLWFFLDITQDGSHKKGELKLGVDKYVRETKNINLFRSVLYIAMDLCLWYEKVRDEANNPAFVPQWERIKNGNMNSESNSVCSKEEKMLKNGDDFAHIKSYYETNTFKPEKDEDGCWHCEECLVGIHRWEDGNSMKLYNVRKNTSKSKYKYPYYANYETIENTDESEK